MKKTLGLLFVLLLLPFSSADLSDYPDMFVTGGSTVDVKIVVGDLALASDTIGAVEIAATLQVHPITKKTFTGIQSILASEVEDVEEENLIVVGGPCANGAAAILMNYPANCNEGINPNSAIIRLFEFDEATSILVAGSSALDTRRASRVLSQYYEAALPDSNYLEVKQTVEQKILVQ